MRGSLAMVVVAAVVAGAPVFGPLAGTARADECPTAAHDKDRRPLAREWFARAEAAQRDGRDTDALRAYECSFALYPHAFTAFNMAKAAEKVGDLELAIERYGTYLDLRREASDRADVERTRADLRARLDRARQSAARASSTVVTGVTDSPARSDDGARATRTAERADGGSSGGSAASGGSGAWVMIGVGALVAAGGGALNYVARSRMNDCHRRFADNDPRYADSCDAAKPLAYGSYAAIGAGAVATLAGLLILILPDASGTTTASAAFVPGGGALLVDGRF